MATIACAKCGASEELDPGVKFLKCEYCESQMYIDRSGVGFYYILPYQFDEREAQGVFKRWAAGPEKAKDLELTARVTTFRRQYFPVFLFRRETRTGEKVFIRPARSTTLPGLHRLKVPAGDIKVFDQHYDYGSAEIIEPNIAMTAYLDELPGEAKEQALVYFPIYTVEYEYRGQAFLTIIDGSSGEVFSEYFPPREASAYYAVGVGGFTLCLVEGVFLVLSPAIAAVALIPTVPILLYLGYQVATTR